MTLVDAGQLATARHAWFYELLSDRDPPLLEDLVVRPAWMASAACHEVPTNVFFPAPCADQEAPRAVCEGCPVLVECLAYALAHAELRGVWGGTGERERREMRRASA